MKGILTFVLLLSLGACCCGPPTQPEPRTHAVRLNFYYLLVSDEPVPAGGPALGAEHARVTRLVPCDGIVQAGMGRIEDPCGLQQGESSILPAGTTLHPVSETFGNQRLAAVVDGRLLTFNIHFPPD